MELHIIFRTHSDVKTGTESHGTLVNDTRRINVWLSL